jgi:hypothetical protein
MKRFVLVISLVGALLTACATSGTKITDPIVFSEVVDVPDVEQSTLYTKVNMWFVDAFKSADSVIQFSDKESGVIKGKYIGDNIMAGIYICKISSTVTVEIKDGKYRISFSDPIYQYIGDALNGTYARPGAEGAVVTQEMADKIKEEWAKLAENLKESVFAEENAW